MVVLVVVSWDFGKREPRSHSLLAVLVAVGLAVLALVLVPAARADHGSDVPSPINGVDHSHDCPPADDSCLAITERLERLTPILSGVWASISQDQWTQLDEIRSLLATPPAAGVSEVQGTVALSLADRERLDLMWWGAWAIVGISLAALLATKWHNSWRFTRE